MTRKEVVQYALFFTSKVPGAIAEAGVGDGTSALWICEFKGSRELHLFDTFTGLPKEKMSDRDLETVHAREYIQPGMYAYSLPDVRARLMEKGYSPTFHPGLIPATFKGLEDLNFSFVHLDLDLYRSTLDSLRYFWPRINKGGVLLIHNYQDFPGLRTAVDLYLGSQGVEVKQVGDDEDKYVAVAKN